MFIKVQVMEHKLTLFNKTVGKYIIDHTCPMKVTYNLTHMMQSQVIPIIHL